MGETMGDMRKAIVNACHKLYHRGYLVATSGNVSTRHGDGMLITPRAIRKDMLTPEAIVECRDNGSPRDTSQRPSSEIGMHCAVYTARPDVNAAVHTHPPFCVACSLLGISLAEAIVPELIVYVGRTPTAPYATPGTAEQATAVKPLLANHDAFLLERHGVLVLGHTLEEAFSRCEQLEYVAQIAYLTHVRGNIQPLPDEEVAKLRERY